MEIKKETKLEKILEVPGAEKILQKYDLPCLACPMARMEAGVLSIGEVAETYDLQIDPILEELNQLNP